MRVNIAIGEQAKKMQRSLCTHMSDELLPAIRLKNAPIFKREIDQLGALSVNLATAQRIMADLGIAHIAIAGQAYSRAVSLEGTERPFFCQGTQCGNIRMENRIAMILGGPAHTIHDDEKQRLHTLCQMKTI